MKDRFYKHGKARTYIYHAWISMRQRCENPKHPEYFRYGARGIRVCDHWQTFENFLADMGERPSPTHSLDRIDNDGIYERANCRWATKSTQTENRRANPARSHARKITAFGKTLTVREWSLETGIKPDTIHDRLARGMDPESALMPV